MPVLDGTGTRCLARLSSEDHDVGAKRPPLNGFSHRIRKSQEADMAPQQHGTSPDGHTDRTPPRAALWLPIFDELADPTVVTRLAAEAEEAGWHGVFVWDHLRWRAPVRQVADPWITLAAIATATERLRLGPWSRPLPAAGRPRSPGKPRPWTGSAVAASPSASAWAATASAASCPKPANNSMTGCEARCSTR